MIQAELVQLQVPLTKKEAGGSESERKCEDRGVRVAEVNDADSENGGRHHKPRSTGRFFKLKKARK
jgi:hypothetical protein